MNIKIVSYELKYIEPAIAIWNNIVKEGMAFPQLETLDESSGDLFFKEQTFTGITIDSDTEEVIGLYILHPNNIGRVGHISNASYAVKQGIRSQGIGEKLVLHCLEKARESGFRLMQFNAVVKNNAVALHLYDKLGFHRLGTIPGGFLLKDGSYEDIVLFYIELD